MLMLIDKQDCLLQNYEKIEEREVFCLYFVLCFLVYAMKFNVKVLNKSSYTDGCQLVNFIWCEVV